MGLESQGRQRLGRVGTMAHGRACLKGAASPILACCGHVRTQALCATFSYLSTKALNPDVTGNVSIFKALHRLMKQESGLDLT